MTSLTDSIQLRIHVQLIVTVIKLAYIHTILIDKSNKRNESIRST